MVGLLRMHPADRARRTRRRSSRARHRAHRDGSRAPRRWSRTRPRRPEWAGAPGPRRPDAPGSRGVTRPRSAPPGAPPAVRGDLRPWRSTDGSAPRFLGPPAEPTGVVLGGPVVGGGPEVVVPAADPVAGRQTCPGPVLDPLAQTLEGPGPAGGAAVRDFGGDRQALPDRRPPVVGDSEGPDQLIVELVVAEALHPDGAADDVGVFEGHDDLSFRATSPDGGPGEGRGHCARSGA